MSWIDGFDAGVPRATGLAVPRGHFIPEELPRETAATLASFFREGEA